MDAIDSMDNTMKALAVHAKMKGDPALQALIGLHGIQNTQMLGLQLKFQSLEESLGFSKNFEVDLSKWKGELLDENGNLRNEKIQAAFVPEGNQVITSFLKAGNTYYNLISKHTGKAFTANYATQKPGGDNITDADVDNVEYFKFWDGKVSKYGKRNWDSEIVANEVGIPINTQDDCTARMQYAIDLGKKYKRDVVFLEGNYIVSDTLWYNKNHEIDSTWGIRGVSPDKTVILWKSNVVDKPCFASTGKISGEFGWGSKGVENFRIKPFNDSFAYKGIGIQLRSTVNVLVKNVQVWNMKAGIDFVNANEHTWNEFNIVERCFINYNSYGIRFYCDGPETSFHGNKILHTIINSHGGPNGATEGQRGLFFGLGCHMYNCHIEVTQFGNTHPLSWKQDPAFPNDPTKRVRDITEVNAAIGIENHTDVYGLSGYYKSEGQKIKLKAMNDSARFQMDGPIHQVKGANSGQGVFFEVPATSINKDWHFSFSNTKLPITPNKQGFVSLNKYADAKLYDPNSTNGPVFQFGNKVKAGWWHASQPLKERGVFVGYKDHGSALTLADNWHDGIENIDFNIDIFTDGSGLESYKHAIRDEYKAGENIISKRNVDGGGAVTYEQIAKLGPLKSEIAKQLRVKGAESKIVLEVDGGGDRRVEVVAYYDTKLNSPAIKFNMGGDNTGGMGQMNWILGLYTGPVVMVNGIPVKLTLTMTGTPGNRTITPVYTAIE